MDPLLELIKKEQGRKRKFERSELVPKLPKVSKVSEVSEKKSESSDEIEIDVKDELKKHITKDFDKYSIIFNEKSERAGSFGKVYDLKEPSGSDCKYVVKILNCMNSSEKKNIDDYKYEYLIKLYNECDNLRYMNKNENTKDVTVKYYGIMETFIPDIGKKGLHSYGIVMEKMDGNLSDLYSKIFKSDDNSTNKLTSMKIFNIILYFIYNLNKANIFHSDFKDSNILYKKIDEKYCLKISDVEFIKRNSKEKNEFLELICFHSMLGSSVSETIQSLLKYNIVEFMGEDYDEKYISSLGIAPGELMHSQYQEIMNKNDNKSLSDHVHEIINETFEEDGFTTKTNCFIVNNLKKDGRKKSHRKKSLKKKSHRKKSIRKKSHRKKSLRKKSKRKSKRKSKKH
jgi:serine/threonine protein kinase